MYLVPLPCTARRAQRRRAVQTLVVPAWKAYQVPVPGTSGTGTATNAQLLARRSVAPARAYSVQVLGTEYSVQILGTSRTSSPASATARRGLARSQATHELFE